MTQLVNLKVIVRAAMAAKAVNSNSITRIGMVSTTISTQTHNRLTNTTVRREVLETMDKVNRVMMIGARPKKRITSTTISIKMLEMIIRVVAMIEEVILTRLAHNSSRIKVVSIATLLTNNRALRMEDSPCSQFTPFSACVASNFSFL